MRAIIVQHEEHEGAGWLGPALEHVGFSLVPRFRRVEPADADAELVVVMGGAMSAFDPHPFLEDEVALLETRLERGAPCLGVCLGAQLLARAAGALVFRGEQGPEIGALPIRWTKAGMADAVTGGGASTLVVAHWHQDTFTPVRGATLLASTPNYEQQAFRLRGSYGFQFHLELSTTQFEQWLAAGREELAERNADTAALEAANQLAASETDRRALVARVAAHCARAARQEH